MLITVGLLILLFVAYQLWGTGIYTAQAQDDLKSDLKEMISSAPATTAPDESTVATVPGDTATTTATTLAPTTTTIPPLPAADPGEAVALIEIPRVNIDWAVVEGIGRDDLKKGPGHYPTTPWPGQLGNAAIAGHRTTYGAPFNRLDELDVGDEIKVTDVSGVFTYKVTRQFVVSPSDVTVLAPPDDPTAALLTLTTCHPKYSANQRLIIQAALVGTPLPADAGQATPVPPAEQPPANPSDNPVLATPTTAASAAGSTAPGASTPAPVPTATSAPTASTMSPAELDEQNAELQAEIAHFHAPGGGFYLWALVVAAIGGLWWYGFKRWTRWYTWAAGVLPFLFVLFFFYRQLEGVLPAGY
jgi:sortase A